MHLFREAVLSCFFGSLVQYPPRTVGPLGILRHRLLDDDRAIYPCPSLCSFVFKMFSSALLNPANPTVWYMNTFDEKLINDCKSRPPDFIEIPFGWVNTRHEERKKYRIARMLTARANDATDRWTKQDLLSFCGLSAMICPIQAMTKLVKSHSR